jgi:hypothetical protein
MDRSDRPLARQLIRASFALGAIGTRIPPTAPGLLGVLGGVLLMSPYAVAAVFDLEPGAEALVTHHPFSS